ncbi:MAG: nuclear transport factor 2 family protein [Maricaulis sp.]|jgi:ketosteroid isomerase-like protein|uniref:nuclear transport factor 2 family protein n=1 Tax=Maricaulis sp. TaxID=1486257 RepID=UPI001B12F615|nr:nuclear transport factor 2 family protein [Maricaulis sp.]MBO6730340.1 nuclear transport factor 2 family protein [Maricaulis sp.]MBO6846161.1 nuclear transport factor 2 family protein [Maricaulis sp.]MBO6875962.1 nuclear transport factor 2 family protein [Maricaulis sp.]
MDLITFASLSVILVAQEAPDTRPSDAETVARDYMAAYSEMDLDRMEHFLSEDAVFTDRTALGEDVGPDGLMYESRDAAMGMLREFDAQYQPIELGFVWDTIYESNGRVVFMGHVNALYPTQDASQNYRWRAEQVTVITVRDGQVIRHQDFANYANPQRGLVPAN